ncbi:hypothetical protein BH09ACT6_BH09ACT6_03930 [soil metagenome]
MPLLVWPVTAVVPELCEAAVEDKLSQRIFLRKRVWQRKAERRDARKTLGTADAAKEPFVLVATDKVAGEGLDLPTLNTLFLTVPVSFKGRVIQQIGRITRGGGAVDAVPAIVHDYLESNVPLLDRMHGRRRRIMTKEGFSITNN